MMYVQGKTYGFDELDWEYRYVSPTVRRFGSDGIEVNEPETGNSVIAAYQKQSGQVELGMPEGKGKLTDSGYDQFAGCFFPVDPDGLFTLSATVTAGRFLGGDPSNYQEAFGLMLRSTADPEETTGQMYANMLLCGASLGGPNIFFRTGTRGCDVSGMKTLSLRKKGEATEDIARGTRIDFELSRLPESLRVRALLEDGSDLFRDALLPEGITREEDGGYLMPFDVSSFASEEGGPLLAGFMACRGAGISIDAASVSFTYLGKAPSTEGEKALMPSGSHRAEKRPPFPASGSAVSRPADGNELTAALKDASVGTVELSEGVYTVSEDIIISSSGKQLTGKGIRGTVIDLDGHSMILEADRTVLRDLSVIRGLGITVSGSFCEITGVRSALHAETGIIICASDEKAPPEYWPRGNRISGCISALNRDESGQNADGFGSKLRSGEDNVFYGCISVLNTDDGFDLFSKSIPTGAVRLSGCIAALNGYTLNASGGLDRTPGNGNGFKLGGSGLEVHHSCDGCTAYMNTGYGFTSNSNPFMSLTDCVAAVNRTGAVSFLWTSPSATPSLTLEGVSESSPARYGLEWAWQYINDIWEEGPREHRGKRESRDYFDDVARTGEIIDEPAKCYPLTLPYLKDGEGSLLDIGCGTGVMLSVIDKALKGRYALYGTDISPESIARASERLGAAAVLLTGDSEDLPFEDDTFDRILCMHSFHHYPHPLRALREMKRVLKKDGRIYLVENDYPPRERLYINYAMWRQGHPNGDLHMYSPGEIRLICSLSGLKVTRSDRMAEHSRITEITLR